MAEEYLGIKDAAKYLKVSISTLRRWEKKGLITPMRTAGNRRRYTVRQLDDMLGLNTQKELGAVARRGLVIGYCRVSSSGQKADLERQAEVVANYCEKQRYQFRIIKDIGSGMNYKKKGLQELLRLVCEGGCSKIVVNYKDRLVRFGYELIETVCEEHNVDIEIINQTDDISYEEELTEDVLAIITVFSAKLYGKRSHRNEQIVAENRKLFSKDDKKETKDSN